MAHGTDMNLDVWIYRNSNNNNWQTAREGAVLCVMTIIYRLLVYSDTGHGQADYIGECDLQM